MGSVREELHRMIDELPDEGLAGLLLIVKQEISNKPTMSMAEWLEGATKIREELFAKYGLLPDSQSILDEIREERLNDLMGGS